MGREEKRCRLRPRRRKGASRPGAPGCAALAPPGPKRPAEWVSEDETQQGNTEMATKRQVRRSLEVACGAMLLAAVMWGVLAAPGFLSDQDSTVPAMHLQEARR